MIYLKTDEEIELMRESNLLLGQTLGELAKWVAPGISTLKLDSIAEEYIRDNGGIPSCLGYSGYPNSICASVNEQVVHGIPSGYVLKDGDIISIDLCVLKNGFHGDSTYTFCVGEVSYDVRRLLKTTKEALYLGIEQAVDGKRVGDISNVIQSYCEKKRVFGSARNVRTRNRQAHARRTRSAQLRTQRLRSDIAQRYGYSH